MASNNKKIWSNLPYSKKIFTLQHKAAICIIISHKLLLIQGILNIYTWKFLILHFFKKIHNMLVSKFSKFTKHTRTFDLWKALFKSAWRKCLSTHPFYSVEKILKQVMHIPMCICSLRHPPWNAHGPYYHLWPARFYNI